METQSDTPAEALTPEVTNGNGATNGKEDTEEVTAPVEESIEAIKAKVAEETAATESSAEGDSDKSEPAAEPEARSVPTSVIASVPKESEDKAEAVSEEPPAELLDSEDPKEASCTVADLIEEEEEKEEETETADKKEEAIEEDMVDNIDEKTEEPTEEEEMEEEEETKAEEVKPVKEGKDEKKQEDKADGKRSKPTENKSAAELAYEWDDEGVEEDKPKTPKKETPKKSGKSTAVLKAEAEVTPGRKSSRTPKLTQKMLESQSQKNLKDPEPEESEEDEEGEEGEESVDAIAKELEKSDSAESKKSPKGKGSAKKGKKPAMEGEKSKEEWVDLIFGANGEKVMEGGKKKKAEEKDDKDDTKAGEGGDDAEDFVPENDTPKTKRGGRPKKKGLDETCEGVGKMGSNMYFYDGGPYIDSDEEDDRIKDKKADSEPARKSSRANKGQNKRLERPDEVVAIPQVKEAPKPNLNPSWLKNHDTKKDSPAKKATSTPTPAAKSTPAKKVAAKDKEEVKEDAKEEEAVEDSKDDAKQEDVKEDALEEEQEPMDTSTTAAPESEEEPELVEEKVEAEPEKEQSVPPKDEELPEFDPGSFEVGYVPKTVKKGDDEYAIVVTGVKDTGLCGGYWGNSNIEGKRRRSKPPETLQLGKNERRGSVGSVSSDKGKESPAPVKKAATATPKSGKKQVTKPEVKAEEETKTPTGRGRKRKTEAEATPGTSDKKAKKEVEGEEAGDSKEASLTSRQQSAVAQALAAGVPGGQQRSVSCVADTNTQREVVVECFAPYDDHRWVNIGKERDGMAPDAVQYARALRPPYHLLSFLRIKGHSTKGMSCTDKNTMVFVVLEGEITVILHTTQFNAKKGDSFYIPPKNYYNLINQKAREAELSLIQFQYDGPLPTVQPSN